MPPSVSAASQDENYVDNIIVALAEPGSVGCPVLHRVGLVSAGVSGGEGREREMRETSVGKYINITNIK